MLRVGNDDVPAVTENISLGGAFLRVDELPATADQVVASIELPHGRSLRVRANIRWRRHEPPGVGIEFDSFLEQGLG